MSTTENAAPSSPPSFMQKVEDAEKGVEKAAAKEEAAQDRDAMEKRSATLTKATERLHEQADYTNRIAAAVSGSLSQFVALHPLGEVVDKYVLLEAGVDALETSLKKVKEQISLAREVMLPSRMDADETKTNTSKDTGNRITRTARLFASILPSQDGSITARAYEWLRNNNLGSLIKETVNSSSLNAAAKELMENGHELPDDIFRVHMKDGVSITKGKK